MLKKIGDFFLCLLREDCQYSIKKFLTYIFTIIAVYVILFTSKEYYDILAFIAVLLGIRAYEKGKEMTLGFKRASKPEETKKEVL